MVKNVLFVQLENIQTQIQQLNAHHVHQKHIKIKQVKQVVNHVIQIVKLVIHKQEFAQNVKQHIIQMEKHVNIVELVNILIQIIMDIVNRVKLEHIMIK